MEHSHDLDEGTFIRIEYTARTADSRHVVDTTDPAIAADADLDGVSADGPVVVVLGEGHLFDPVEDAIREAGVGRSTTAVVEPADAFGERDPQKRKTVPVDLIPENQRDAGRTVSVAGRDCVIESVDGETATLDYNHSLAGVTLEYDVSVLEHVTGDARVSGLCALHGINAEVTVSEGELSIILATDEPSPERDRRRRSFVRDVGRLLPADTVTVTETYSV